MSVIDRAIEEETGPLVLITCLLPSQSLPLQGKLVFVSLPHHEIFQIYPIIHAKVPPLLFSPLQGTLSPGPQQSSLAYPSPLCLQAHPGPSLLCME